MQEAMRRTGLYQKIGDDHLFRNATLAIAVIHDKAHRGADEKSCPLLKPVFRGLRVAASAKRKTRSPKASKAK